MRLDSSSLRKLALSLALTVGLVWLLLKDIDPKEIVAYLVGIPPTFLFLGFLIFALASLLRAFRLRLLMQRKLPLRQVFWITGLHNLLNSVLPLRLGEFALLYLLGRHGERKTKVLGSLLLMRVFDFTTVALLFAALMLVTGVQDARFLIIGAAFAVLIIGFFAGLLLSRPLLRLLRRPMLLRYGIYAELLDRAEELVGHLKEIRRPRLFAGLLGLSFGIWALSFLFGYLLVREMGLPISAPLMLLGFTITTMAAGLPIHGIAGLGTVETAWTLVFVALGAPYAAAVTSGFAFHALNLLYVLGVGAPSALPALSGLPGEREKPVAPARKV